MAVARGHDDGPPEGGHYVWNKTSEPRCEASLTRLRRSAASAGQARLAPREGWVPPLLRGNGGAQRGGDHRDGLRAIEIGGQVGRSIRGRQIRCLGHAMLGALV